MRWEKEVGILVAMHLLWASLAPPAARAAHDPEEISPGKKEGVASSQASQATLPYSKPIGYVVLDKGGKVVCGKTLKGPVSQGACGEKMEREAMGKLRSAQVRATQTACGPACAVAFAAVICAVAGAAGEAAVVSVRQTGTATPATDGMQIVSGGSYAAGIYRSLIAGAEIVKAAGLYVMKAGKAVATVPGTGLLAAVTVGVCMVGSETGSRIVLYLSRSQNDIQKGR